MLQPVGSIQKNKDWNAIDQEGLSPARGPVGSIQKNKDWNSTVSHYSQAKNLAGRQYPEEQGLKPTLIFSILVSPLPVGSIQKNKDWNHIVITTSYAFHSAGRQYPEEQGLKH